MPTVTSAATSAVTHTARVLAEPAERAHAISFTAYPPGCPQHSGCLLPVSPLLAARIWGGDG